MHTYILFIVYITITRSTHPAAWTHHHYSLLSTGIVYARIIFILLAQFIHNVFIVGKTKIHNPFISNENHVRHVIWLLLCCSMLWLLQRMTAKKQPKPNTQKLWQRSAAPTHRKKICHFSYYGTKEGRGKKKHEIIIFCKRLRVATIIICIEYWVCGSFIFATTICHHHLPSPPCILSLWAF